MSDTDIAPPALSRVGYRNLALLLASMTAIGPFSIDTYPPEHWNEYSALMG